jgi:hypothetical protein
MEQFVVTLLDAFSKVMIAMLDVTRLLCFLSREHDVGDSFQVNSNGDSQRTVGWTVLDFITKIVSNAIR